MEPGGWRGRKEVRRCAARVIGSAERCAESRLVFADPSRSAAKTQAARRPVRGNRERHEPKPVAISRLNTVRRLRWERSIRPRPTQEPPTAAVADAARRRPAAPRSRRVRRRRRRVSRGLASVTVSARPPAARWPWRGDAGASSSLPIRRTRRRGCGRSSCGDDSACHGAVRRENMMELGGCRRRIFRFPVKLCQGWVSFVNMNWANAEQRLAFGQDEISRARHRVGADRRDVWRTQTQTAAGNPLSTTEPNRG